MGKFLRTGQIVSGLRHRMADPEMGLRLSQAFIESERRGLVLASIVRGVIVVAMMLAFALSGSSLGEGHAVLVLMPLGLGLIGLGQYLSLQAWPASTWPKYVFVALDCIYILCFLLLRNGLSDALPPAGLSVREGALIFFVPLLVQAAFSYSPRFMLWTGACASVAWFVVVGAVVADPATQLEPPQSGDWAGYVQVSYLPLLKVLYDYVIFALAVSGLAACVWRSRHVAIAAAVSERARANLARHFSPKVVDQLSNRERPFGDGQRQLAAVLFADIRGFTTRCESMSPEEAMAFLREFHARMEVVIFRHGGTLDKILGDGLLAVFGVPERGHNDAADALACANAMMVEINAWNAERAVGGDFDVHIGVGLHYGPVMTGDVGSERLMTFTVVGDTVNVASRLQSLTKEVGTWLVASEALVHAARQELQTETQLLDELTLVGPRLLRGRERETVVYARA